MIKCIQGGGLYFCTLIKCNPNIQAFPLNVHTHVENKLQLKQEIQSAKVSHFTELFEHTWICVFVVFCELWCIFQPKGMTSSCFQPVAHDLSSVILFLALLSSAYSLSNFSVFHLLPHSPMSGSFILTFFLSHTHISASDTPAQLLCSHCNYISFAAVPHESLP